MSTMSKIERIIQDHGGCAGLSANKFTDKCKGMPQNIHREKDSFCVLYFVPFRERIDHLTVISLNILISAY
jgi:hypothetical protein